MSLVEVMVSAGILTLVSIGILTSFVFARKASANNLAQSYGIATAQSILEQVVCTSPTLLTTPTETGVEIKLPVLNASNYTSMPRFVLPWAADDTTYTGVLTSPEGVLVDAAYIVATNEIHPERYMPIEFNLQRTISTDQNRVDLVLRYRWQIPDRRNPDGTPIWMAGQIRTIRSKALRF